MLSPARRGRATLTAEIASRPTCWVGYSGPFDSRPILTGVGPLLLGAAGVLALGIAAAILRSFGRRYRVGRLLAVVPQRPVAEAIRIAEAGETRYVRIDGRI